MSCVFPPDVLSRCHSEGGHAPALVHQYIYTYIYILYKYPNTLLLKRGILLDKENLKKTKTKHFNPFSATTTTTL